MGASTDTFETQAIICNELGMHARAATKFVQLAAKFPCEISVEKDGQQVNGKSIMGILMLVAAMGSIVIIRARGACAKEAAEALAALIGDRFGEEK